MKQELNELGYWGHSYIFFMSNFYFGKTILSFYTVGYKSLLNALNSLEYFRSFNGQPISRTLHELIGEKVDHYFSHVFLK